MSDLKVYPKAQVALGNGNLAQVHSVKLAYKNSAKVISTLARSPSGVTVGPREATLSYEIAIDEDGPERDYHKAVKNGTISQNRVKLPGGQTIVFTGMFTTRSIEGNTEGEVKEMVEAVGDAEVV